jgi:hypothetical protein
MFLTEIPTKFSLSLSLSLSLSIIFLGNSSESKLLSKETNSFQFPCQNIYFLWNKNMARFSSVKVDLYVKMDFNLRKNHVRYTLTYRISISSCSIIIENCCVFSYIEYKRKLFIDAIRLYVDLIYDSIHHCLCWWD